MEAPGGRPAKNGDWAVPEVGPRCQGWYAKPGNRQRPQYPDVCPYYHSSAPFGMGNLELKASSKNADPSESFLRGFFSVVWVCFIFSQHKREASRRQNSASRKCTKKAAHPYIFESEIRRLLSYLPFCALPFSFFHPTLHWFADMLGHRPAWRGEIGPNSIRWASILGEPEECGVCEVLPTDKKKSSAPPCARLA